MQQLAKIMGETIHGVTEFLDPLDKQLCQDILDEIPFQVNVKCQYFRLVAGFHHAARRDDRVVGVVIVFPPGDGDGVRKEIERDATPAGMMQLIHWAQETIASFKRRGGFCPRCLEKDEPIAKLLAHHQSVCAECFLGNYLMNAADPRKELSDQLVRDLWEVFEDSQAFGCDVKNPYFKTSVLFWRGFHALDATVTVRDQIDEIKRFHSPLEGINIEGFVNLIEWVGATLRSLVRRGGFCRLCLAEEPPQKRFRVHQQLECAECFLAKRLQ